MVIPEEAGTGHAPQSLAKAASERIRSGLSPKIMNIAAAVLAPTAKPSQVLSAPGVPLAHEMRPWQNEEARPSSWHESRKQKPRDRSSPTLLPIMDRQLGKLGNVDQGPLSWLVIVVSATDDSDDARTSVHGGTAT